MYINFRLKNWLIKSCLLSLCLMPAVFLANDVLAQGTAGVGVRPAIISEKLNPGETRQFSIQLNNLSGTDQTYYLSKKDIVGMREGGVPIYSTSNPNTGYELSDWITLEQDQVTIPVSGSAFINFTLRVPNDASPGGHFGGIIVSINPPEIEKSGASVGYEVANIVSIRVAGDAKDLASIRQFSTSKYIYGKTDVDFSVRIENDGNTLVTPTGPLEIYNMFGEQVTVLKFNENQAGVYPKTAQSEGLRTFDLKWQDDGLGFGRYEAVVSLVYGDDGNKNTISSTVSFWILPMNIIGPAILILGFILLFIYIAVRMYVKRSVAMLTGGSTRRLVRARNQNQFPFVLLIVSMLSVTALFMIVLLLLFA